MNVEIMIQKSVICACFGDRNNFIRISKFWRIKKFFESNMFRAWKCIALVG